VADRSAERTLWLAGYVALVLAPVVLLVVAPYPGGASFATTVAAGLGFAGLTVLALQVVMPSRARAFTAPFGIDVLLRFHRQLGAVALILVIAHVVVLIAEDSSRFSLLDIVHAPFRAKAGVVAILALLALTATSLWRRPLRLPYEAWRALHVLLGLAVIGFAFAHVIGVSKFVATGPVRWGVLLFVLAAGAAAFYLRIGRPFAAGARPYAVRAVRRERGGATTLELAADGHPGVPFGPGQFAWIKLAHAPYSLTEHPFSFASSAERPERPAFTIKALGDFTERVAELEPGTPVLLDGPHGSFHEALPGAGFVLVVGGIGITPAMSLLRTLADRGDRRPVTLLYGSREWDDVTFRDELQALAQQLDLDVVHVLSQPPEGWDGERGRIDAALLERVLPDDVAERNVLVCGPPEMTAAARAALRAQGVPRGQLHVEDFARV
jgi:predicted ferric reductase